MYINKTNRGTKQTGAGIH